MNLSFKSSQLQLKIKFLELRDLFWGNFLRVQIDIRANFSVTFLRYLDFEKEPILALGRIHRKFRFVENGENTFEAYLVMRVIDGAISFELKLQDHYNQAHCTFCSVVALRYSMVPYIFKYNLCWFVCFWAFVWASEICLAQHR